MRDEKDKKNAPMATYDEAKSEAPGIKVGATAWKWPPVWPYDNNFFKRQSEMEGKKSVGPMDMLSMNTKEGENATAVDDDVFDSMKFWEENSVVKTELNEAVADSIKFHYSFYLRDGMSVLELGAAEDSYLPDGIKLGRHVAVGATKPLMEQNPSIEESYVVDLNEVIEDEGVKSEEFAKLLDESYDAVIMANTIDFLIHPREVFKSAWRALKPGGIMIVPFIAKDAYTEKFGEAQTKQWGEMTDDQHMWICGSFFQFSAGEGWETLNGFDISPEGAKKEDEGGVAGVMAKLKGGDDDAPPAAFCVQARKKFLGDSIDEDNLEDSISSRLWMLPTLENRDKKLLTPRLSRMYEALASEEEKDRMVQHFDALPKVYESLIKMDQFAFTFSMQAQLAADLAGDPDFVGNDAQIANLKMGLGLRKPSKDFWAPVGKLTSAMTPDEKVNLLAYVVPRFGSGDPAQDSALESFVSALEPTFTVIRSKCPGMKEADVQLVGSEILAAEVLKPGLSSREDFAVWLGALGEADFKSYLEVRKSYKVKSDTALKTFQEDRVEETKRVEEKREKIKEQVMEAREMRTIIFNPATGKVEELEQEKEGFKLPF